MGRERKLFRAFGASLMAITILGGCIGKSGRAPAPELQVAESGALAGQTVPVRPRTCPELRVRNGTELLRRYARGMDGDPDEIVYQASFAESVRECLARPDGRLTVRVGVSIRLIAGPRGKAQNVALPLRLAVVRDETTLQFSKLYRLSARLSTTRSTTISEVYDITIPAPARGRIDVVYVGFDESG